MAAVEATHAGVSFGANWCFGNFVSETTDQMAQRVTAKRVTGQQDDVQREHKRSNTYTEMFCSGRIREPHRFPGVVPENETEQQREVKKIAVNVLHDERKGIFAQK